MDTEEKVQQSLNAAKRLYNNNIEYWLARDLQGSFGYSTWENFEKVIEKAKKSCESTGIYAANHFHETTKLVNIGSDAKRNLRDYYVSRYGAYLIAMNGSPNLPEIATAQNYFAVQTRRQELTDQALTQDINKRVELRERVKQANKFLGKTAKDSGVQNYGLFHAAGYAGLYGLNLDQIKEKKGIDQKEELLDRAGRAELAANEFRITQTEEALKQGKIVGDINARKKHEEVGKEVRATIKKIGGTLPEDLPAEPSIKKLVSENKKKKKITKSKNK